MVVFLLCGSDCFPDHPVGGEDCTCGCFLFPHLTSGYFRSKENFISSLQRIDFIVIAKPQNNACHKYNKNVWQK